MSNPFLVIALTMVVTPGAGFVLFVSTAFAHGRTAALAMASGIVSGAVIIAGAVVLGFPAVRAFIPQIVLPLRVVGGLYLVFLGARNFRSKGLPVSATAANESTAALVPWQPYYRAGIFNSLTNPGLLVMYLTLLPGFVPLTAPWVSSSLVLAATHISMIAVWYTILFTTVTRLGPHFATPHRQRSVLMVAGVMLMTLGLRTAATAIWS